MILYNKTLRPMKKMKKYQLSFINTSYVIIQPTVPRVVRAKQHVGHTGHGETTKAGPVQSYDDVSMIP